MFTTFHKITLLPQTNATFASGNSAVAEKTYELLKQAKALRGEKTQHLLKNGPINSYFKPSTFFSD